MNSKQWLSFIGSNGIAPDENQCVQINIDRFGELLDLCSYLLSEKFGKNIIVTSQYNARVIEKEDNG